MSDTDPVEEPVPEPVKEDPEPIPPKVENAISPEQIKDAEEAMRLALKGKIEGLENMKFSELVIATKIIAKMIPIKEKEPPRPNAEKGGQPDAPTIKRVPTMMERAEVDKTLKALNRASGFAGQAERIRKKKDLSI